MPRKPAVSASSVETKVETKDSKKSKKSKKEETVEEPTETTANPSEPTETKTKTVRHVPTRESVEAEFDEIVASIEEEINKLRESTSKSKGVKFLRSVNKRVKTLKSHALRVTKQRKVTKRNNNNSGFLKPVPISTELAKFTGWNPSELRSRVDVTKYICSYIKEHNLQDPNDRRNIQVENDAGLKKLLKYDSKDKKPLTYYSLQTCLKSHFPSAGSVTESKAEAPAPAPVASEAEPAKRKKKVKA